MWCIPGRCWTGTRESPRRCSRIWSRRWSFAPLHDPEAIALIRDMMGRFPHARHYACFDTVFHHTMPAEASTYAIPIEYRERGVRRYGFHGLSCESVVDEMRAAAERGQARFPQRMVIAHLGSGCSVTALEDGRSVDTTMGLTPTGGVVMGTRPGDLDPGLVLYLLRQAEGDRVAAMNSVETLLNHKAGMVALSGLPNDMRAVRKAETAGSGRPVGARGFYPQCAQSNRRVRVVIGWPGCRGLYRRHRGTRCEVPDGNFARAGKLRRGARCSRQ